MEQEIIDGQTLAKGLINAELTKAIQTLLRKKNAFLESAAECDNAITDLKKIVGENTTVTHLKKIGHRNGDFPVETVAKPSKKFEEYMIDALRSGPISTKELGTRIIALGYKPKASAKRPIAEIVEQAIYDAMYRDRKNKTRFFRRKGELVHCVC